MENLTSLRPGQILENWPQAALTNTDSVNWDNNTTAEIAVPAGALFARVSVSSDCFLVMTASADNPTADGELFYGGGSYPIPCEGKTHLHTKKATTANAVIRATFYGK